VAAAVLMPVTAAAGLALFREDGRSEKVNVPVDASAGLGAG